MTLLNLLILFVAASAFSVPLHADQEIDAEGREMSQILGLITESWHETGEVPRSWGEIWNEDSLVDMHIKWPLASLPYERYSFVQNHFAMPSSYNGSLVEGEILLIKTQPTNFQDRELRTTKAGLWWEFIWLEHGKTWLKDRKQNILYGSLPVEAFEIGSKEGQVQIKELDVSETQVVSLTNRLADMGFDFKFKSATDHAESTYTTELTLARSALYKTKPVTMRNQSDAKPQAMQYSTSFPWLVVMVGLLLIAVIGLIGFKVSGKSSSWRE